MDHPPADRPTQRALLRRADFTDAQIRELESMRAPGRRVWHPAAGWGTAESWFGLGPLTAPVVRFDQHPDVPPAAACPWNLVYPN